MNSCLTCLERFEIQIISDIILLTSARLQAWYSMRSLWACSISTSIFNMVMCKKGLCYFSLLGLQQGPGLGSKDF